jgi:hypothetical protein
MPQCDTWPLLRSPPSHVNGLKTSSTRKLIHEFREVIHETESEKSITINKRITIMLMFRFHTGMSLFLETLE